MAAWVTPSPASSARSLCSVTGSGVVKPVLRTAASGSASCGKGAGPTPRVPMTPQGPDLAAMEQLAKTHQPKLYLMNAGIQNPTGAKINLATAHRLLALAQRYDFRIVEDDIFAPLGMTRTFARKAEVEQVLLARLAPTKVNLASLGNAVPHLHWHVIARFDWDSHYPSPVWAPAQRPSPADREDAVRSRLPALEALLRDWLAGC